MAIIMAAMAAIFKSHSSGRKSSKYRILPNFELRLEISNIMPVCKFEINWSKNKNLRALTTYLGVCEWRQPHDVVFHLGIFCTSVNFLGANA